MLSPGTLAAAQNGARAGVAPGSGVAGLQPPATAPAPETVGLIGQRPPELVLAALGHPGPLPTDSPRWALDRGPGPAPAAGPETAPAQPATVARRADGYPAVGASWQPSATVAQGPGAVLAARATGPGSRTSTSQAGQGGPVARAGWGSQPAGTPALTGGPRPPVGPGAPWLVARQLQQPPARAEGLYRAPSAGGAAAGNGPSANTGDAAPAVADTSTGGGPATPSGTASDAPLPSDTTPGVMALPGPGGAGPAGASGPAAPGSTAVGAQGAGAPAPAAAGPAGSGGQASHGAEDIDELSRRLYDRIRDRLKAELYLDRERAGQLSDLTV